ncbi:hypothetical protein VNO78_14799 [Psophocarpus tetragonolobus]|uniref:Uncharacterized protein n=1 Tax=Psophocarpus tetragonolobus TaxID=3891 RepID=A0AAN9SII3_PSOTE
MYVMGDFIIIYTFLGCNVNFNITRIPSKREFHPPSSRLLTAIVLPPFRPRPASIGSLSHFQILQNPRPLVQSYHLTVTYPLCTALKDFRNNPPTETFASSIHFSLFMCDSQGVEGESSASRISIRFL